MQVDALLQNAKLLSLEEAPAKMIAIMQQIIMAINALSKVLFHPWILSYVALSSFL